MRMRLRLAQSLLNLYHWAVLDDVICNLLSMPFHMVFLLYKKVVCTCDKLASIAGMPDFGKNLDTQHTTLISLFAASS